MNDENLIREALNLKGFGGKTNDALDALARLVAERDRFKRAFQTEVRVCSARTAKLQQAQGALLGIGSSYPWITYDPEEEIADSAEPTNRRIAREALARLWPGWATWPQG